MSKQPQPGAVPMIPIGKTDDLLNAKPMAELIRAEGVSKEAIKKEIQMSILKCSESLGVAMTPDQVTTLSEDILEVYKYESVEDITLCLKRARQGYYMDVNNYGKINMPVFKQWMSIHLDMKYEAKEKQIQAQKVDQENDEPFDRDKYYKEGMELFDKLKAIREKKYKADEELARFKAERYKQSLNSN